MARTRYNAHIAYDAPIRYDGITGDAIPSKKLDHHAPRAISLRGPEAYKKKIEKISEPVKVEAAVLAPVEVEKIAGKITEKIESSIALFEQQEEDLAIILLADSI